MIDFLDIYPKLEIRRTGNGTVGSNLKSKKPGSGPETVQMTMKTTETLHDFDEADFLDDDEQIAEYLTTSLETGDAAYIAHALGVVARAKGMSKVAEESGVSRELLYRSLSNEGNPTLRTMLAILPALGVRLTSMPLVQARP